MPWYRCMGFGQKTRSADKDASDTVTLHSWKEIAAYLNRDPRTVQLWEKSEGLPVHRINHNSRASVYAYAAEIDRWLLARSDQKPQPQNAADKAAVAAGNARLFPPKIAHIAALLVVAVAITGLAVAGLHAVRKPAPQQHASSVPLLAVLPFEDQTSTDDLLAGILTDSVIRNLGRFGQVEIVTRQSALPPGSPRPSLRPTASAPRTNMVLEGTIARIGGQIQLTVELLSAPAGEHLWGTTYIRKGDPWLLPGEIGSTVAADVIRRISGFASSGTVAAPSINPQARQVYLAARFYWNQRNVAGFEKAIALYRKTLVLDPRYAPAYAGLAECYALMTDHDGFTQDEAFRLAKTAAVKALALDPGSADAYNALAFVTYRQDWDFARADQYFQKAVALDPNSAVAHQWYGEFLGDLRRFDASIAELRKARQLDPLSPMVSSDLADGYLHAEHLAEADAELRRVLDLYPDFAPAHVYRVAVLQRQGNLAAAAQEAQNYARQTGDKLPLQMIVIRQLAVADRLNEARQAFARLLAASPQLSPYSASQLYFVTGQPDQGYAALARAMRQHCWWLVTMLVDPGFDTVRAEPRFLDVARRVGLPVDGGQQIAFAPQAR